ncbi:phage repressor protein CI [Pectobacterium aquaticum]|uniref:phage repressor protein CI n=1 Tax=Pectobacterium aquaticum TaxID=2204145 RepID=UPI001F114705|nr:phage repressor protein CI [Pectobacterium aquaticum]
MNLQIDFTKGGTAVLDRIIDAYGFSTKLALADHLGIASSSLANRYKRDFFPSDVVVRCMAETGASLEWLATGKGKKFDDESLDILKLPHKKLVDGQLYDSGYVMFDKALFLPGVQLPEEPFCVIDEKTQYLIDKKFADVYDGEWLVEIEEKTSIRTLTRIPVRKVRVSGVGMAFDCALEDINVLGRVIMTISI